MVRCYSYGSLSGSMAHLEITTVIGCTLNCTFCPQTLLNKSYEKGGLRQMSLERFKHYIETVPKHISIHFSGMSEPFLNPECMEMVEYSIAKGHRVAIFSTLAGMNIKQANRIGDLLKAGKIACFVLHLPDAHDNMPGFRLSEEYIKVLRVIVNSNNIKMMTMSKESRISEDLINAIRVHDKDLVRKMIRALPKKGFNGNNRSGNLGTKNGALVMPTVPDYQGYGITCGRSVFYDANVLLPNGDVQLCCQDYGLQHKLGNLGIQSYYDLFKSQELAFIRSANQSINNPDKDKILCTQCDKACCWEVDGRKWVSKQDRVVTKLSIAKNIVKLARELF